LSVSSLHQDSQGREHSKNLLCLNSEEPENIYSKHLISLRSIFGHKTQ